MDMTYDLTTKSPKPKWFQFRRRLSNWFLWLAKKIYPENPEVWAFFCKIMVDTMITGQSIVRVEPSDFYKATVTEPIEDVKCETCGDTGKIYGDPYGKDCPDCKAKGRSEKK